MMSDDQIQYAQDITSGVVFFIIFVTSTFLTMLIGGN